MTVEDWIRCPHCGGECEVTQPAIYNSRFECRDCDESITQGWVYYDQE